MSSKRFMTLSGIALIAMAALAGCPAEKADQGATGDAPASSGVTAAASSAKAVAQPDKAPTAAVECDKLVAQMEQLTKGAGGKGPTADEKKQSLDKCNELQKSKGDSLKTCYECIMKAADAAALGACQKPQAECDGLEL